MSGGADLSGINGDLAATSRVDRAAASLNSLDKLVVPPSASIFSYLSGGVEWVRSSLRKESAVKAEIAQTLNNLEFRCEDLDGKLQRFTLVPFYPGAPGLTIFRDSDLSRIGFIAIAAADKRTLVATELVIRGDQTLLSSQFFEQLAEQGLINGRHFKIRALRLELPEEITESFAEIADLFSDSKQLLNHRHTRGGEIEYMVDPPRKLSAREIFETVANSSNPLKGFCEAVLKFAKDNEFVELNGIGSAQSSGYAGHDRNQNPLPNGTWTGNVSYVQPSIDLREITLSRAS